MKYLSAALLSSLWLGMSPALAAPTSPPDKAVGAEAAFVQRVQRELRSLYPTPASAKAAGYYRYTDEDDTGAISYVDPAYWKSDIRHPSQLWYGVTGELLGADYSVPMAGHPALPVLWGVNPTRWSKFGAHVHWVLRLPNGAYKYSLATSVKKYEATGGDVHHPTAAPIVKLGKAKSAAEVVRVFAFPDLWDLEVWVKRNPKGAFANANPLVHVTKKPGTSMGM